MAGGAKEVLTNSIRLLLHTRGKLMKAIRHISSGINNCPVDCLDQSQNTSFETYKPVLRLEMLMPSTISDVSLTHVHAASGSQLLERLQLHFTMNKH